MGERNFISTTAAFLAEALYRQDRDDEALRMTEESEEIAAADDVATQYLWRTVRAKLIARAGRYDEAEAMGERGDPDHRGRPGPRLAGVRLSRPERRPALRRPVRGGGRRRRDGRRPLRAEGQRRHRPAAHGRQPTHLGAGNAIPG